MKCNKKNIGSKVIVLAVLKVSGLVALTGGVISEFKPKLKESSAQPNPAYTACTGKNMREACSFSPETQANTQAPPSSLITDPQDKSIVGITSAVTIATPARAPQPVSGECTIDPVDEVGGDTGLKCVAPTGAQQTKPQIPTRSPAKPASTETVAIQQNPAVVACQGKKLNDSCRKVITIGSVIKDDEGRIIGGTAEGLSPISLDGICTAGALDAAGNAQLVCTLPMEKARIS